MCEIPNLINFFESDIRIAVVYNMSILWGGGGDGCSHSYLHVIMKL